jgi:threonyl-tRNA synthetase
VAEEFRSVLDMHQRVYDILGIHSYYLRLSEWDPEDPKRKNKYVDDPAAWEKTQQILADVLKKSGVEYVVRQGEAAFYGPKIDIQFKTVTGREETASTCQLDFSVAERLGLTYVDSDNKEQHPYIIHRAPLGSHERFVAFLIEHFAGAFPTWLAPIQIKIITIHDDLLLYAHRVCQELRSLGLRAEIDESQHSFSKKIRLNSQMKIPNLLVIGQKEMQENKITLRRYQVEKQQTLDLEFFKKEILKEVKERRRESIFSLD